ncbi:MAG: extracellular solute-binding protein [Anaerolineae bacterium]|nr:extracellular solute-binding protein [Anaerolineae bacterium]
MSAENKPKRRGKNQLSRRDFLRLGVGSAAAVAASAASPVFSAPMLRQGTGDPAVVRFWSWYTDQEDQFPKVVADFEALNPNIKVELQILADVEGAYLPALLAAAAANDLPEIYAPHVYSVEFGKQGLGADLIEALGADFMEDFFPSASSMFIVGDAQYAVGWMAQTMGFYYDPAIFEQAGIDGEPETWDDMIAASNQVKERVAGNLGMMQAADNGFSVNDLWFPMITGFSDDPDTVKRLDEGQEDWSTQPVVDALTLYRKTLDEGLWQPNQTGMDQVACLNALYVGQGAAFYSGSWNPGRIYKDAPPELVERLRVMKTPAVAAGGRHWTGNSAGAAFSVANNSANKDAALEFMRYLYSPEVYSWVMSDSVSLPATRSAAEEVTDPIIKTMASWLPDGCRHWLTGPAGQIVADTIMSFTVGDITDPVEAAQIMHEGASELDYS